MNLESLKTANPKDLAPIEFRPHYITRRYAEFVASIISVLGPLPEDVRDKIVITAANIREVLCKLLNRLSEELKDKKDQPIFLINNYDLILTIINERGVNAEEVEYFRRQMSRSIAVYVEDQFASYSYFGLVVAFSREVGPLVESSNNMEDISHPKFTKDVVESILREFSQSWRNGILGMYNTVTKYFPNLKNGMQLFQIVLEKLFSYYRQFTTIILKCFKQLRSSKYFVAETEITYEIRKYNIIFD